MREQAELLDRASDGIYVRGLDHRVRYWNRGAERIYGWAPAQAAGRDVRELLREEAADFSSAMGHANRPLRVVPSAEAMASR